MHRTVSLLRWSVLMEVRNLGHGYTLKSTISWCCSLTFYGLSFLRCNISNGFKLRQPTLSVHISEDSCCLLLSPGSAVFLHAPTPASLTTRRPPKVPMRRERVTGKDEVRNRRTLTRMYSQVSIGCLLHFDPLCTGTHKAVNWQNGNENIEWGRRAVLPQSELPHTTQVWNRNNSCMGTLNTISDSLVILFLRQNKLHSFPALVWFSLNRIFLSAKSR